MKQALLGIAAIAALIGAPAQAADMPLKAPPPPIVSWTGFYVGLEGGGRWSNPSWDTTCLELGIAGGTCPFGLLGFPAGPTFLANNNPANFNSASLWGGVYGGYNFQVRPTWVVGLEGDFADGNNTKTIAGIPGAEHPGEPTTDTSTVTQTWDAGLRARLGYLVTPSTMLFVSGGGAWTHVSARALCGATTPWCTFTDLNTTSTASATLSGWSVGGGLEYRLASNLLVRGEYRYSQYGNFNYTLFPGLPPALPGNDSIAATLKLNSSTALAGIAYKFGGP